MANSNRMALYNDMSQHDNFGTFDQFNEALDNPDNMQAAYDFMKDKGDYGTFDDFAASMTRDDGAFELPNPAATAPVQTPEVAQTSVPLPDPTESVGTDVMWQSDANPGWGADELPATDPESLSNVPQADYTGVTDTELKQANVAFNDKYKDTTEFNSLDELEDYRNELGDVLDKDMELYSRQREADKLEQLNFDYSATDDADLKKIYEEADSLLTTAPNVTDRALAFAKRNSAAAEIGNRQRDEQAEKQAAQKAVTAAKTVGLDAQSQQNKANFERLFGADEKRQNEIAAEAVKREKKVYDNAVMVARQYTDEQLDKAINDTLATNGRGYEVQAAAVALLQEKQARTRGMHGKTVAESECDAIIDGTDNQRLVEYCTKWQLGDPGFDSTRESGFKDVPDIVIGEMFASMVDKSNLAANKQFEEELSTGIYQGSPAMAGLLMSQGARRIAANDYTTMLNTCIEKYGRDKLDAYIIEYARKNNIRVTDAANKVMGWITKATIGKLVDAAKPTSDAQYYALGILNGMFTTRVLGGLTRLASGVDYGNTTPLDVAELSMQEYRKGMTPNEQLISDITITTVPLIIDPTTFALPCQAGKMSGNLMLRTMGVNIADATAVRSAQKGALGLAQRLIGGAANFATFEIQMLPVEAMRTGTLNGKPLYDYVDDNGKQHKGLSAWEITKEFAKSGGKGAIGGAALAGTGLVSERLTRAWTGVGAYLGTALQLGVESSALTVNEYLFASDKEKAEFEWATKFAGSFAMVIGTKIWHAKDIVKDMKARAKGLYDPNVTMKNLSKEDADALAAKGYPTIAAILRGWNKETFKEIDRTACAEELGKMMSDKNVNWEQFRMAEWALEGVMMPAPLMADYQQERTGPGEYSITLVDKNGRAIGSPIIVKGTEGLKQARQKLNLEKEKNAVALGEDGLRHVAADANMTSAARAVAETINRNLPEGSEPLTADDVKNMVTAIVNKEGRGEELNTIEKEVKNDMLTMLNGTSMAFSGDLAIANLRAEMESKHGVKIAKAIRKPVSRRTDAEKAAIADYVEALKDFATGIKSGKTTTQLTQTDAKGAQKATDELKKQDTDADKEAEVEESTRPKAGTHGEVLDPDIAGMHPDEMAFFNKRPRRAVKLMNDMAKVLGVPIRLYNGVGKENGMFDEGVIWVNRNSDPKTAIGFIIGHEVTHHLKQSGNPALFDVFRDHAILYQQAKLGGKVGENQPYRDYVNGIINSYRKQYHDMYIGRGMTEEEAKAMAEKVFAEENAIEEITCDVAGKIFSDMTAARDILGSIHDRTRLDRLKDAVMHTIESIGLKTGWTSDSRRRLIEMREPLRNLFDARLKAIKDEEERAKRDVSTQQPEAPKAEQPQRVYNGRPADIDDVKKLYPDEDFDNVESEEIDRTIEMLESDRQLAHDYAEGRTDKMPYYYKHWAERDGLDTFGEEPAPKTEQPAPETAPPATEEPSFSYSDIKPVGRGVFGDIYDQFKGKVKEAFNFLIRRKSGDVLAVWHRDDVGDIDLVWGTRTENAGLDHIIDKHVGDGKDFANEQEMMSVIDEVVQNGTINPRKSKWDKVTLEKDGKIVVISKNVRDASGNITANKNWVVTSFDNNIPKSQKQTPTPTRVTPESNQGGRAVTPGDVSEDKGSTNSPTDQTSTPKTTENSTPKLSLTQEEDRYEEAARLSSDPNASTFTRQAASAVVREHETREVKEGIERYGITSISDAAMMDNRPTLDLNTPKFSFATEESIKSDIKEWADGKEAKDLGWTKKQVNDIAKETSEFITMIHKQLNGIHAYDEWAQRKPTVIVDWRDGQPRYTVSWSRNNIEYKYDVSADLLCVNNEGIEDVLSSPVMAELMKTINIDSQFASQDYLRLYNTLRDLGFVVPCKGCFDAAARFKMLPSVARKFAALTNQIIDERNSNPEAFDNHVRGLGGKQVSPEGFPLKAKSKEDAIRIAVAAEKISKHIQWTELMSAKGQTQFLEKLGGLFRAWQRTGAGRPKDKLLPEPYNGVLVSSVTTIIAPYGEKTPSFRAIEANMGTGVRRNSHSEYRPILFVDEYQFVRECFLKKLRVFKYMKELDDVRAFGKLGIKFNMSFFPAFVEGGKAAGLDANGGYTASEESVGGREFPYVGEDGRVHYDGMRGWEEAKKYVNEDCSLSTVIFSVPHFIKTLTDVPTPSDPRGEWGSAIPFHASGATAASLKEQGLGEAKAMSTDIERFMREALDPKHWGEGVTNFEAVQNDRFGEGWVHMAGKEAGKPVAPNHKVEFKTSTHYYNKSKGVHLFEGSYILDSELNASHRNADGSFNAQQMKKDGHPFAIEYNDKVREIGGDYAYIDASDYYINTMREIGLIPRFAFSVPEEIYLRACEDAGCDPRHPKLGWKGEGHGWTPTDSEAYYALFCDYGMTDAKTGKYSPHREVGYREPDGSLSMRMPDNITEVVRDGIMRYQQRRDIEASMVDDAIREFTKRSVDAGRLTQEHADEILSKNELKFSINNKEREQRRDSDESKRLFEATKQKFGTTNDIREAGYILPDGTMLDFSGRHWMDEGHDSSHLAGNRAVDHRNIYEVGYDKDENETGFETDMTDFISRGAIRVHRSGNYSRINLSMEPTPEQMRVLRRFASGVDNVDVDFGDGNTTEHFVEYNDAWPSRVVGDIDRYFTEGIRPQGTPKFSINPDKEVENVVVDANVKLPTNRKEAVEAVAKMGKPFINRDQNKEIVVSNTAIKHSATQDKEHNFVDVRCMGVIDKIIEAAVKIGDIPVKADEIGHTHKAEVYYCPVNVNGTQHSARLLVKQYENRGFVLDDFQLYDLSTKQEKTGNQTQGTGTNALTPLQSPVSRYKISELIHSTQEEDLKLLGIGRDKPKFSLSRNEEDRPTFFSVSQNVDDAMRNQGPAAARAVENERSIRDQMRDFLATTTDLDEPSTRRVTALLNRAMANQRQYDKVTVDAITKLAKDMMDSGLLSGMTDFETKQLLTRIKNANGRTDITPEVNRLMDVMLNHQVKQGKNTFNQLLKTRARRVNQSGVQVASTLDAKGGRILDALKMGITLDEQTLADQITDAANKLADPDVDQLTKANMEDRYTGLMLAQQHYNNIRQSEANAELLKKDLRDAKRDVDNGNLSREAYKQLAQDTDEALRKNKIERIEAYELLNDALSGNLSESAQRAKEWREQNKQRVEEIHHDANRDMQGRDADPNMQDSNLGADFDKARAGLGIFTNPNGTFNTFFRWFGKMFPQGEGNLYNRFVRQNIDARQSYWQNFKAGMKRLDEKAEEIFGKGTAATDLYNKFSRKRDITVSVRGKDYPISQLGAVYLVMCNRQVDGRIKLRYMGIDDAQIQSMQSLIDPKLMDYMNWVQKEFFPELRVRANEVHKRVFGTDMDDIENYFPLKINERDIDKNDVLGSGTGLAMKPSVVTGGIIKRKHNNKAIDFTRTDALSVVFEHLQEMEHWTAFAELARDLNSLLSYKRFENQIKNAKTLRYGGGSMGKTSGDNAWEKFVQCCQITTGDYHPESHWADETYNAIIANWAAAKITFRTFTAFKQFQSGLVGLTAAEWDKMVKATLKYGSIDDNTWQWAIDNLPLFAERWQSRLVGDTTLDPIEVQRGGKSKLVSIRDAVRRGGLTPNATIDALTVAVLGRGIYETRKGKYLKAGYSEDVAERRALQDAAIVTNETQQSSQGAFVAPIQKDPSALSKFQTQFRNASMAYTRKFLGGVDAFSHFFSPSWRAEAMRRTQDMLMRDGLSDTQAANVARRLVNKELFKGLADMAMYGAVMPVTWAAWGKVMPKLLIAGGLAGLINALTDDDTKKSLAHLLSGWMEGFVGGGTFGEVAEFLMGKYLLGEDKKWSELMFTVDPVIQEANRAMRKAEGKPFEAYYSLANEFSAVTLGVDASTFVNLYAAAADYADGDLGTMREILLLFARINNMPESQLEKVYIDEVFMDAKRAKQLSVEELARRYAKYKRLRNAGWFNIFTSAETDKDVEDKYVTQYNDMLKERFSKLSDSEVAEWGNATGNLTAAGKEIERRERASAPPMDEKKEEEKAIKDDVRLRSKVYSSEQLDSAFNAETDSVAKAQLRLELMKDEGVKNPRGEQSGDSDAMKAYHKAQTDDDVRKDARISKVRTKLKPIKETFNKMGGEIHQDNFYPKKGANVEKLQKYKAEHLDELEALRWLTVWDAYMKKYRARIAKGEDPEKVMNEVRESRTNLFKHLSKFIDQ